MADYTFRRPPDISQQLGARLTANNDGPLLGNGGAEPGLPISPAVDPYHQRVQARAVYPTTYASIQHAEQYPAQRFNAVALGAAVPDNPPDEPTLRRTLARLSPAFLPGMATFSQRPPPMMVELAADAAPSPADNTYNTRLVTRPANVAWNWSQLDEARRSMLGGDNLAIGGLEPAIPISPDLDVYRIAMVTRVTNFAPGEASYATSLWSYRFNLSAIAVAPPDSPADDDYRTREARRAAFPPAPLAAFYSQQPRAIGDITDYTELDDIGDQTRRAVLRAPWRPDLSAFYAQRRRAVEDVVDYLELDDIPDQSNVRRAITRALVPADRSAFGAQQNHALQDIADYLDTTPTVRPDDGYRTTVQRRSTWQTTPPPRQQARDSGDRPAVALPNVFVDDYTLRVIRRVFIVPEPPPTQFVRLGVLLIPPPPPVVEIAGTGTGSITALYGGTATITPLYTGTGSITQLYTGSGGIT